MPAGLQVFNDSNTIQVDDTYFNLMLVDKFAVGMDYNFPDFSFNVSGVDTMIAYTHGGVGFPAPVSCSLSGSTWTYAWKSFWPNSAGGGVADTMTVYVFGHAPAVAQNEGLQVFNSAGTMVYQSVGQPMKFDFVAPCDTGYTGTSGKTYAVAILRPSALLISLVRYVMFPVPSGNTITPQLVQTPGFANEGTNVGGDGMGIYAAVNVTGY